MNVLYRFFSASDELLYVGITNNPPQRFAAHRNTKSWWHKVSRIEMEHFDSREHLLEAEKRAIRTENPKYNIAHSRPEVEWRCDVCGGLIKDGRGYVTIGFQEIREYEAAAAELGLGSSWKPVSVANLPEPPRWKAMHQSCDPDVDSFDYFFYVEELRTKQDVIDRTRHLLSKRWLQSTRWDLVLAKASVEMQEAA